MYQRCKACGAGNPAINRFCGKCGMQMESPRAEPPEDFWRDARKENVRMREAREEAGGFLSWDLHGSNRAAASSEQASAEVASATTATQGVHRVPGPETHSAAPYPPSAAAGGASVAPYPAANPQPIAERSQAQTAQARTIGVQIGVQTVEPPHERTGVSGPSFLGLADEQPPQYDYEFDDEEHSHLRRNIALAVLAAVVVLAAIQWRAIRSYGFGYVHNGPMTLSPGKTPLPAPPAKAAATPTGSIPNAGHEAPAEPSKSPSNTEASRQPTPNSTETKPATPASTAGKHEPPSAMASPDAAAKPSAAAEPKPRPTPGEEEMIRARRSTEPGMRAMWLWRAVGKGNPQAPVELAAMYERGIGVSQSCDQARVLLNSAAAKGNEQARIDLQLMQQRGCAGR